MRLFTLAVVLLLGGAWVLADPATGPATRLVPAAQLLDSMLQPTTSPNRELSPLPDEPRIDASSGNAVAPQAPALNLRHEGSFIVDRVGRLARNADGQMEFAFDSDGQAMQDPPVIVLPSLKLMAMEETMRVAAHEVRFSITGMVTEYHGRNYLLVEKAQAVSASLPQY
jgi:hypothetical protein